MRRIEPIPALALTYIFFSMHGPPKLKHLDEVSQDAVVFPNYVDGQW